MAAKSDRRTSYRVVEGVDENTVSRFLAENQAHNPKSNPAILRWQYGTTTFGPTISVFAEDNGEVVGHYSLFGIPALIQGSRIKAAHGADLVIHPEYRRYGIATELLTAAYEAGRHAGYEMVVSNPNHASLRAFTRAGFKSLPRPNTYFLTLDPEAITKRLPTRLSPQLLAAGHPALNMLRRLAHSRGGTDSSAGLKSVVTPVLANDAARLLSVRTGSSHTGVESNDERWWRWRYEAHPHQRYRFVEIRNAADVLVGLGTFGPHPDTNEDAWLLYECSAINQRVFNALVRSAATHSRAAGANMFLAGTSSTRANAALREQLRRAGFLPLPNRLIGRALNLGVTDLSGQLLDIKARDWRFSFGDQDHL